MNIGDASKATKLPVRTIRYYEQIGLVSAGRSSNGYRQYGVVELHKLHIVRQARSLGFTVDDCRALLSLYEDEKRPSVEAKKIASEHLDAIDAKISRLRNLRKTIAQLVDSPARGFRPYGLFADERVASDRKSANSVSAALSKGRSI